MMTGSQPSNRLERRVPMYLPLLKDCVIRLFHLQPGSRDDPIQIQLFIVELSHHPSFEALSYVWGDSTDRVAITCNGHEIHITRNLHDALRRLRRPEKQRSLWVDAICINQGNTRERSHHVGFMNTVYESAERVLVYLGSDEDHTGTEIISLMQQQKTYSSGFTGQEDVPHLAVSHPETNDAGWKAVSTLLRQSWFTRAWVIQEVGLGKKITAIYGTLEFDYRDFIRLLKWSVSCAPHLQTRYNLLWWNIHLDWYDWSLPPDTSNARDALVFLYQAKPLECTDPRDHIYAFLGHELMKSLDPAIVPDYDKEEDVFNLEIAKYFLRTAGTRLLAAVEHDDDSILRPPTWAPRWNIDLIEADLGVLPENWFRFSVDGMDNLDDAIRECGDQLRIRGILFDVVDHSFRFPALEDDAKSKVELATPQALELLKDSDILPKDSFVLEKALESMRAGLVVCPSNDQDILDVFSLSLCAGRTTVEYTAAESDLDTHRNNFAAYWKLRQSVLRPDEPMVGLKGDPNVGNAEQFAMDFRQSCRARTFIMTEKGYVGLGPWIAKPGDVCCLVPGSMVPFVLRRNQDPKVQDGHECFKLVGDAYLHGLMRGEVWDLVRRDGLCEETITII